MVKIITEPAQASLKRRIDAGTEVERHAVQKIMNQVAEEGDKALFRFTAQFDQVELSSLRVSKEEIIEAYQEIDTQLLEVLGRAASQIEQFHLQQKRQSWMMTKDSGTMLGQMVRPLERVGVYVPGGSAPLVSTVLMNVIPAKIAGVEEIVMATPPLPSGKITAGILVAADMLGVTEIVKVGGAQAIAAFAYGTETVAAVDKVVGPGNIYVALAKREVYGLVDIDMIAGPSDITVLADGNQNPAYIAADMLSQAEHDPLSEAVCVTTSAKLAEQVKLELEKQLATLPRQAIAQQSLENKGAIYVVNTLDEAIAVVNQLAPEHLEILVSDPHALLGKIKHAGAIFLGPYSSEPVGDYYAGPNHVLPTSGNARFSSALSVDDFVKKSSIISYSKDDFWSSAEDIMQLARYEGLEAHARAIQVRLEKEGK